MNEALLVARLDQAGLSGKEIAQQMKDNLWEGFPDLEVVLRSSGSAKFVVASFGAWSCTAQGGAYWEGIHKKLKDRGL